MTPPTGESGDSRPVTRTRSPEDATAILCCPATRQSLRRLEEPQRLALNAAIRAGARRYLDGEVVTDEVDSALVTDDGAIAYGRRGGIWLLLANRGIRLSERAEPVGLRREKQGVQRFYDEVGWSPDAGGGYGDTARFVDQRSVSREYFERCHRRLGRRLPRAGRFLLDAGSGAIPHSACLEYSRQFARRICVDLSVEALREAQGKLGDRGLYVLGDVTRLPIRDGTMDAAICLHAIYHVPADEQRTAFDELHRVLAPGAPALVVYTFGGRAPLVRAARSLYRRLSVVRRRVAGGGQPAGSPPPAAAGGAPAGGPPDPELYGHFHPSAWFAEEAWAYPVEIVCWRSIGKETLEQWFHAGLGGRILLRVLFLVESAAPRLMGRIGQYPLVIIRK